MRRPAAALGIALAGLLMLGARPAPSGHETLRTVTVRLAVDRSVIDLTEWRFESNSFLDRAARVFRSRFAINLTFKEIGRWAPGPGRRTIEDALAELAARVPVKNSDIVVGFIDPENLSSTTLGIASYTSACILLSTGLDGEAMRYAFLHELCHVFGAIDLKEKGSVMSLSGKGRDIDPFTAEAVRLNRDRVFARGLFPLSGRALGEAIDLYKNRASLDLGEPETYLFLTLFYLEMDDLDAATQACSRAAIEEPGLPGIQVMLGNVRLSRGQPELAAGHFEKALERQPVSPGIHFNLGLAYAGMGRYAKAVEQFRAALKCDAGFVPARLALARLLLAAESSEAAAAESGRVVR